MMVETRVHYCQVFAKATWSTGSVASREMLNNQRIGTRVAFRRNVDQVPAGLGRLAAAEADRQCREEDQFLEERVWFDLKSVSW